MFLRTRRGRHAVASSGSGSGLPSAPSSSSSSSSQPSSIMMSSTTETTTTTGGFSISSLFSPLSSSSSLPSQFTDMGYLLFNMFTSIAVTFVNEAVFSRAEFGFPSILCLNGFIATFVGTEIMRCFSTGLVEPIHVPSTTNNTSTTTAVTSTVVLADAPNTTTKTKIPSSPPPPTATKKKLSSSSLTSSTGTSSSSSSSSSSTSSHNNNDNVSDETIVKIPSTTTTTTTKTSSHSQTGALLRDVNFLVLVVVVGLSKTLNNVSLQHNSMGVYQIFKLLVTPAIVLLEYCLDGRVLSPKRAICLALVCGFCVGSIQGDLQISSYGLFWATVWLPFAAIFKVQWARVKKLYRCSTVSLMHAVMPYACFLQLAIAPIVDPPGFFQYQWTVQTVLLLSLSAVGAFFVLFSSFLVLGHVGPLSHTLLGPLKTATTMIGSTLLLETKYSTTQIVTAAGALLSLAAYTHVTITEQRQHKDQQQHHEVEINNNEHHHQEEGVALLPIPEMTNNDDADVIKKGCMSIDQGDDTVATAASSTSTSGDEGDVEGMIGMDDSERTFV